jgi:N utilization substance protein A
MAQATKNDFIVAIAQICTERGLSKETVLHAVEQALVSAYKRNYGGSANISAKIDPNSGKVRIYAQKTIVDNVLDRRAEITLAEAREIDPMADIGGSVAIESTPDNFGRIAAQTAKQVVLQRIREAERDTLYTTFHEREGEIVQGTVKTIEQGNITVDLGRLEGVLPKNEQIPTERYRHNQKIRALITEVNKSSRGPQVMLSRTHRNMLRRLLEIEVPEIFNGLVEIKSIAREAGQRSKVAVSATQDGIDPVGACVGQRGVRIQAIVNELNGEKIDVIEWNPNPQIFIASALSPAKVTQVSLAEDEDGDKVATVVVADKQLSLAIGKEGQNARLAAKLTGWRIDIKSEAQMHEEQMRRQMDQEAVLSAQQIITEAEEGLAAEAEAPTETLDLAVEPVVITPAVPVEPAPRVETPVAAPVAEPEPEPEPEEELTFAEALKQFEQRQVEEDNEPNPEDDERTRKLKEDRRKRQTLVFDPKAGKVVAQKKHKGGKQDWLDELSEDEDEITEEAADEAEDVGEVGEVEVEEESGN